MKTPHKHAAIIKAWADGADIQYFDARMPAPWWIDVSTPQWNEDLQYRVKPAPQPDRVYYGVFERDDVRGNKTEVCGCFTKYNDSFDQIKVTFDGETGKLKSAEVL